MKIIIKRQKSYSLHSDSSNEIKIGDMVLKKTEPGKLAKLLGRVIKPLGKAQEKFLDYNVYVNSKKIGNIELSEESKDEINGVWLDIDPNFRGQHRATKILQHFIKLAKLLGYKYFTLEVPGNSKDARHIYEKLGFKEERALTTPQEDECWGGLTKMRLVL